ncbi:MAG: ATP-binding cassette domain-containing protein [Acetobacteraceae bacterium]
MTSGPTPPQPAFTNIVKAEKLCVNFGKVQALTEIDIAIGKNDIVGLIGDNGAGKSTLIKALTGVVRPSSGRLFIRDEPVDLTRYSVRKAHALRFETVYQQKSLGEKQPLWRNFFAARQIVNRLGFINVREERRIANEILQSHLGFRGVGIDANSTVSNLSGGERQGIAIGRAMHFDADLIILDEPTTALAISEVQKVLDFVRWIKESGRAAIYIEHNLAHIHGLADRLVVIDRGHIAASVRPSELSLEALTRFMIELQQPKAGKAA